MSDQILLEIVTWRAVAMRDLLSLLATSGAELDRADDIARHVADLVVDTPPPGTEDVAAARSMLLETGLMDRLARPDARDVLTELWYAAHGADAGIPPTDVESLRRALLEALAAREPVPEQPPPQEPPAPIEPPQEPPAPVAAPDYPGRLLSAIFKLEEERRRRRLDDQEIEGVLTLLALDLQAAGFPVEYAPDRGELRLPATTPEAWISLARVERDPDGGYPCGVRLHDATCGDWTATATSRLELEAALQDMLCQRWCCENLAQTRREIGRPQREAAARAAALRRARRWPAPATRAR